MREIKFRGKRVDNEEFVEGDLIHGVGPKFGKMFILPRLHIYPKDCHILDGYEVLPETIGQFTGLSDKNGKEIFEGDIVAFEREKDFKTEYVLPTIIQLEDRGENGIGWTQFSPRKLIAIIGNIHDNPELIK